MGEGGLDGTGTKGKTDAKHRMNHVVNAKALCTDSSGHKNAVEKAEDPAEKACSGEKKGARQKGPFFGGEKEEGLLHGNSEIKEISINLCGGTGG